MGVAMSGTLTIQKKELPFSGACGEIKVWEYDPFFAGGKAKLLWEKKMESVSHEEDETTQLTFEMGDISEANLDFSHYITANLYSDLEHCGKDNYDIFYLDGFNSVQLGKQGDLTTSTFEGVLTKLERDIE